MQRSCKKILVTMEKVELELFEDGRSIGKFIVLQNGKIQPEPESDRDRELIERQATAWRKELS